MNFFVYKNRLIKTKNVAVLNKELNHLIELDVLFTRFPCLEILDKMFMMRQKPRYPLFIGKQRVMEPSATCGT